MYHSGKIDYPVVGADRAFPGIRGETEHMKDYLITQCREWICFNNGVRCTKLTQDHQGVDMAKLFATGIPQDNGSIRHEGFSIEDGCQPFAALMELPELPCANGTFNDNLAFGDLWAVHERAIRAPLAPAPGDFDDIAFFGQFCPPHTIVYTPSKNVGRRLHKYFSCGEKIRGKSPAGGVANSFTHLLFHT